MITAVPATKAAVLLSIALTALSACSGFEPRDEPGLYVSVESATLPEIAPGPVARHWDPSEAGCEPDAYVVVATDTWECITASEHDTLDPAWSHSCPRLESVGLTWLIVDADPDADEVIAQGEVDITEGGELWLEADGAELLLVVERIE